MESLGRREEGEGQSKKRKGGKKDVFLTATGLMDFILTGMASGDVCVWGKSVERKFFLPQDAARLRHRWFKCDAFIPRR